MFTHFFPGTKKSFEFTPWGWWRSSRNCSTESTAKKTQLRCVLYLKLHLHTRSSPRENAMESSQTFSYLGFSSLLYYEIWVMIIFRSYISTLEKRKSRNLRFKSGSPYWRRRLSTVDLLVKIGCFCKQEKYSWSMKSTLSEFLVSTRRSTVHWSFPFNRDSLFKLWKLYVSYF